MKTNTLFFTAFLLLAAVALAQMETPKPGPEVKKLDTFAGSWTLEGDVKASPMGPGGKVIENQKCDWMEGSFYLVCHSDYKSATMGNGVGMSIMGYSADDKAYTYREFNSWGEFADSRGSVNGDTWTWTSDEKMGGQTMKGKFTMKVTSPTSYSCTYEMSPDGAKWTTAMDCKATKK